MEPNNQKSYGALLGAIIIVLLIIVGGLYLIRSKVNNIKEEELAEERFRAELSAQAAANDLSNSDEFEDIETDLEKNSEIDSLDSNLE